MKNKPTRHKSTNTFKFQSFSERIANIDVNVFHKVKHPYEDDDGDSDLTYFHRCVEKWETLNCSEGYRNLVRSLPSDVHTLPQLLIQKENIVNILIGHVKQCEVSSLIPALELIVELARDLRNEFYPYFFDALGTCIYLLNTQDAEQIEVTFVCLAYLFKYLFQYIVKHIDEVLKHLLPLLSNSQPRYITDFAAQSFAYVARKVKDRTMFMKQVLNILRDNPEAIKGLSQLIFEVMKGVNKQFHSCSRDILSCLLHLLMDVTVPQPLLVNLLDHVNDFIARYITQETNFEELWALYLETVNEYLIRCEKEPTVFNLKNLWKILQLVNHVLYCKRYLIPNYEILLDYIVDAMAINFQSSRLELHKIIRCLLQTIFVNRPKNELRDRFPQTFRQVVDNIRDENLAMECIKYFSNKDAYRDEAFLVGIAFSQRLFDKYGRINRNMLNLLMLFVLMPPYGLTDNGIVYFPITSENSKLNEMINYILNTIPVDVSAITSDNVEDIVCSVLILSRVQTIQVEFLTKISKLLDTLSDYVGQKLSENDTSFNIGKFVHLFVLCADIINLSASVVQQLKCHNVDDKILNVLLSFGLTNDNMYALKTFDRCVTPADCSELIKGQVIKLGYKLSYPFHQLRSVVAEILWHFNPTNFTYAHIYHAERITMSIDNYREKLRLLQYLECTESLIDALGNCDYLADIVYFLIGNLFINFRLIWDPVLQLLISHARLNPKFWSVYLSCMSKLLKMNDFALMKFFMGPGFMCNALNEFVVEPAVADGRPDFTNVRYLLLKLLQEIINFKCVEINDVINLFTNFMLYECTFNKDRELKFINMLEISYGDDDSDSDDEDNDHNDNDDNGDDDNCDHGDGLDKDHQSRESSEAEDDKHVPKIETRLLLAHLEVFAKINLSRIPTLQRKTELLNIYVDLLSHKSPRVQKTTVDCIFNYKIDAVVPYKEHIYKIIDDKTFKDELVYFQLDEANGIIKSDHRKEVLKIIMRILYGRLLRSFNNKAGQHNRELIFRFLTGCNESEWMMFIKMGFQTLDYKIQDDAMKMTMQLFHLVNIERVTPLNRYLSALNMTMILFQQAGSLIGKSGLSYLLRVILVIGTEVHALFTMKTRIYVGYYGILNKLRYRSYEALIYFYNNFDGGWDEINAIFTVFVWPFLTKLPIESVQNPTLLMKLILCWGTNPKYHRLLTSFHSENETCCFDALLVLLQKKEINYSMRHAILDVIENLLFPDDDLESDNTNVSLIVKERYATTILRYLQSRLESSKGGTVLNKMEFLILSELSKCVDNTEQSDLMITLLLPILEKKCTSDEQTVVPLLQVIHNLIRVVSNSSRYCQKIAPFFNSVSCLSGRKLLCEIIVCMGSNDCSSGQINPSIIQDLNAMDRKWIEQPDYARRLEALNTVQTLVDSSNVSLDTGILIVYNCFYTIRTEKDIALKDNSGMCLRKLSPLLCAICRKRRAHKSIILDDVLFPIIRDAIRGNNESLKYECVMLLGQLAKECAKFHPVLKDLSLLTDPEGEHDFFENIQHLQVYQKMKALHRFCDVMSKQVKCPQPRSLTQFILPLVSQFLLSSQYANKNSLIDSAINSLKIICQLLPWRQYETILSLYLGKVRGSIQFQKQTVRIVSAILDAFHYNIGLASEEQNDEKNSLPEVQTEVNGQAAIIENGNFIDEEEFIDNDDDNTELIPAVQKQCTVCRTEANRISKAIRISLLPYLNKCFIEYTESRKFHKSNKKQSTDDTEDVQLLTIPLAAAIAKLLYRLPPPSLDQHISGLFMKLCTYLKSRLQSVRIVARETMQNILLTIGPKYLPQLLSEMTSLLTRGFQVHVLVFTCHSILESTKHLFQKGDLDECLELITELCMVDLFGELAEEKEVDKIARKTLEARGNKSFNMLHILAEYISEKRLLDIIIELKDVLYGTLSRKTVLKVAKSLHHVTLGFVDNKFMPSQSLLIVSYGVVSKSIPVLTTELKRDVAEIEREHQSRRAPDSLIIPADPKNATSNKIKVTAQTNAHILMEFGLEMLQFMLKRQMVKPALYKPYLDPFVPEIAKFIKSSYVKLNTLALQCLAWLFKYELPSLVENVKDITGSLFDILHRYATEGSSAGDNQELVMATFKAVSVLVREVKFHQISPEQLRALLLYVEQGIYNYSKSSTAFTLLKAILMRKYTCNELHSVMQKVFELCIQSESDNVRLAARQAFYRYLVDYPIEKNLKLHLSSCVAQLQYERQSGRYSALELLDTIIGNFPIETLQEHCLLLFTPISIAMVNDEAVECRKKASDCLNVMVCRLKDTPQLSKLFDVAFTLMKSDRIHNRMLAARILELFVEVVTIELSPQLATITQLICGQFNSRLLNEKPGRFVQLKPTTTVVIDVEQMIENENDENSGAQDHFIFTILQLTSSLVDAYPDLLKRTHHIEFAKAITEYSHRLLAHPHEWVRLGASQLIYRILSTLDSEHVASACTGNKIENTNEDDSSKPVGLELLGDDVKSRIKRLALDLCDHLVASESTSDKVITQAMKNLLFISEVLKFVTFSGNARIFSLPWLIKRIERQIRFEITKSPQSTTVRSVCYNWFAALTTKLTSEQLTILLPYVLPSLVREITIETNNETESTIRGTAKEALRYYRDKVPQQDYARVLNQVRVKLQKKRIEKRVKLAEQLVTDPERASKRKIAKQLKKKQNKKRKLEKLRHRKIKRKRTIHEQKDYDE